MRSQPVVLLTDVEADIRIALDFYNSWLTQGGPRFYERFKETVSWIEWNAEMFPKKYRYFRRAIIRKSYFGVYYVVGEEATTLVAVLDLRQNPRAIRALLLTRPKSD